MIGQIGIKNQIYQCFIDFFGEIRDWQLPVNWIDDPTDWQKAAREWAKSKGIIAGDENGDLNYRGFVIRK